MKEYRVNRTDRHELGRHLNELISISGFVKNVSSKSVGNLLLCDVTVQTTNVEHKYDHMWLTLPKCKKTRVGSIFEGVGHIKKYNRKNRSASYGIVLH